MEDGTAFILYLKAQFIVYLQRRAQPGPLLKTVQHADHGQLEDVIGGALGLNVQAAAFGISLFPQSSDSIFGRYRRLPNNDANGKDAALEADMLQSEEKEVLYKGVFDKEEEKSFYELLTLREEGDVSGTNNSSVALIIECNGRSVLLTGDAPQESLIPVLEEWRVINRWFEGVTAIKVPHHASLRNTNRIQ